jgi:RNA polymerase sigma-70 factor (ECF subfamily)
MDAGLVAVLLENRPALLRFLRARGAGEAAEDLLQELWVKASAGAGQPIADPLAYLYRMAANLVLDHRRAELRRARREEATAQGESDASDLASGERLAMSREELRQVEAVLAGLGERTETVFRRFRLEGGTQRQIAGDLGISLSAVEKHLQRAYRALLALRRRTDAD